MELLARVRRTIRRHELALPDTRGTVALSGGSDSVALAYLLRELTAAGDLRLAGLAHFNHQLRAAADRDEEFSASVATELGLPFVVDREDVGARARRERRSIESAAHAARHAFFARARLQLGADVVALGHTKDDQAETFLLRLLRGASARGLASMHPRIGSIVRPLLDCRRDELRAYLDTRRVAFVRDESNQDVSVPRNRVRAELLPLIAQRFNPSIVDVLADQAALARDEFRYLQLAADDWWLHFGRDENDRLLLDVQGLLGAHVALARVVMWKAMSDAARGKAIAFADVERALALVRGSGGAFDAPGQRVQRIGTNVVLTSRSAGTTGRSPRQVEPVNFFQYSLSIPGEVQLPEAGCALTAEMRPSLGDSSSLSGRGAMAAVQLGDGAGSLGVRNRRPGDRFRPFGLDGRKKLQDFFVDRKVPRERRSLVPIVVDASDRIVWVAGHAIDEAFRVTDPAQAVLILRLKGVGGSY